MVSFVAVVGPGIDVVVVAAVAGDIDIRFHVGTVGTVGVGVAAVVVVVDFGFDIGNYIDLDNLDFEFYTQMYLHSLDHKMYLDSLGVDSSVVAFRTLSIAIPR